MNLSAPASLFAPYYVLHSLLNFRLCHLLHLINGQTFRLFSFCISVAFSRKRRRDKNTISLFFKLLPFLYRLFAEEKKINYLE